MFTTWTFLITDKQVFRSNFLVWWGCIKIQSSHRCRTFQKHCRIGFSVGFRALVQKRQKSKFLFPASWQVSVEVFLLFSKSRTLKNLIGSSSPKKFMKLKLFRIFFNPMLTVPDSTGSMLALFFSVFVSCIRTLYQFHSGPSSLPVYNSWCSSCIYLFTSFLKEFIFYLIWTSNIFLHKFPSTANA